MEPDAPRPAVQLALFDAPCQPLPAVAGMALPPPAVSSAGLAGVRGTHAVCLGGQQVAYRLRRARRRSIGFVVGPDGLAVSAPRWLGLDAVESALRDKARWILRKLAEQQDRAQRHAQARVAWHDGTVIPYLGQPMRVGLDPTLDGAVFTGLEPSAAASQPAQHLRIGLAPGVDPQALRAAVLKWLQSQAQQVFSARCGHYAPQLGVQCRRLRLSAATTRWGSASADGSVRLNWRLIHLPLPTIDYVVVHELAHLREMNHGPAFWALVQALIPEHARHRAALRSAVLPAFD